MPEIDPSDINQLRDIADKAFVTWWKSCLETHAQNWVAYKDARSKLINLEEEYEPPVPPFE